MPHRSWFPLFSLLLAACAGCELGTKVGCNVDGDCFDGLSCIAGACYKCAADKVGCACEAGGCFGGMVCGARDTCGDCSETDPCRSGLACDAGRCVECSSEFAGCPCDSGQCGSGLRCGESTLCEPLACGDDTRNGDETDVDCGGSCLPCREDFRCLAAADCESLACDKKVCLSIGSCVVPTDEYPTIQSAVDDTSCTTVSLDKGIFDEHVRIDRPVEIVGARRNGMPGGRTTLSSATLGPVIEITGGVGVVYLRHLTIRDGSAERGAGVFSRRGLVVENSLFTGNRASINAVSDEVSTYPCGGAIASDGGDLTVQDSIFVENQAEQTRFAGGGTATARGGAICAWTLGEVLIERSEFRGNLATTTTDIPAGAQPPIPFSTTSSADGGAIHRHTSGPTVIRDSTFISNEARTSVVSREGELRSAQATGGAIFLANALNPLAIEIERSDFVENVAHADGAGVGSREAKASGGAVRLWGVASIHDTTFEGNWALATHPLSSSSRGGGASLEEGGRIEATRFHRNRADGIEEHGGALYFRRAGTIANTVFWDNHGSSSSGIETYLLRGDRVWLLNSTLVGNAPGPQLSAPPYGELVMRHSVVFDGGAGPCDTNGLVSRGYNVLEEGGCLALLATDTDRVVGAARVETVYERSSALRVPHIDDVADVFSAPGFPLIDSPVIDSGDPNGCLDEAGAVITVDNRGAARTGACDIGAFAFDSGQSTRTPLTAFILRQVTPRAPDFFSSSGSCENNVTQALTSFMNESATRDNDRPPDYDCDGLIDAPLLLILDTENDGSGFSLLRSTQCVANHVACQDPWSPSDPWPGTVDFRINSDDLCSLGAGNAVVSPGAQGCIEAEISGLQFDVGVRFDFMDAELIGQLDLSPRGIWDGVLRGFIQASDASDSPIPSSIQAALGGATSLSDLLCAAELEERDGVPGYFIEFDVEFEAVTLYGQGLPVVRPMGCE